MSGYSENHLVREYYNGVVDGVCRFAHWKDGVQYVGTCGKTLKQALEEIQVERKKELASTFE